MPNRELEAELWQEVRRARSSFGLIARLALAWVCAASATVLAAAAAQPAPASAPAPADPLATEHARVKALADSGELAAADTAAAAYMARCERERGPQALETARAIELWARVREQQQIASEQPAPCDSTLLKALDRAVRIEEQTVGTAHAELGDALELAGVFQYEAGNYKAARELQARALELHEKLYGPDHPDTGASLINLGDAWSAVGDFAKARPCFERGVAVYERAFGADSPKLVNPLKLMARAQHDTGDYQQADLSYTRLVRLLERLGGPEDPRLISALSQQAFNRSEGMQRPDQALPLLQRSLAMAELRYGATSTRLSTILVSLGSSYVALGDPAAGLPYLQRAAGLGDADNPAHAAGRVQALNSLGQCLSDLGRYDEAKAALERAVAGFSKAAGPDHPNMGAILLNTGVAAVRMGDYDLARTMFERVLRIDEAKLGPEHPFVAEDTNNLAGVQYLLGDFDQAVPGFERAVEVARRSLGPAHADVGKWTCNLASCLAAQGNLARAQELFESGLAIQQAAPAANPVDLASARVDYARLLAQLGRPRDAVVPLEQALATRREALGERHPDTARTLQGLGNVLAMLGETARARAALEQAAATLEEALGPSHPDVGRALRELSMVQLVQNEPIAAAPNALRAERIGRDHLRLLARGLSEREALAYAASRSAGCDIALAAALQAGDATLARAAWDELVRSRALVLDEMAARRQLANASPDTHVVALARRLQWARTRLANLTTRQPQDQAASSGNVLAAAQREKEAAERELAGSLAPLAQQLARDQIGWNEVAAAVPRRAALLAFARAAPSSQGAHACALVLSAGTSEVRAIDLGPSSEVDAAVRRWRDAIHRGAALPAAMATPAEQASRATGSALRALIWDPVAPLLAGADEVFLVPDGALHLVAFGALPVDTDAYLIEQAPTLHLLTTERDLVSASANSGTPGSLLALGGPAFDAGLTSAQATAGGASATRYRGPHSECVELTALSFAPLPGAEKEVRGLPELLRNTPAVIGNSILTGRDATEERFKAGANRARIVHLATHGFVLGEGCPLRAAGDPQGWSVPASGELPRIRSGENPLVRCGLALAGANHRQQATPDQEDGIVTAEEIASLDLSRAQWVVLSACDTGVGELAAGEGVLGLHRAFQIAGASTVIHTLWPIDDALARTWVDELYRRRYRDRQPTARAAREATLKLLGDLRRAGRGSNPFQWAAFVAAGRPD